MNLPIVVDILMSEREKIGRPSASVAHDHWYGRRLSNAFEHDVDRVFASLENQAHHRRPTMTWEITELNIDIELTV